MSSVSKILPRLVHRSNQIMWFLGAGASVTAGIPTAGQMIWDFKRKQYCADKSLSLRACKNLNDQLVRKRIQKHFDGKSRYPGLNSEEEYSFYFEELYPSPKDRRDYIEDCIKRGEPSRGNRIFASLMKMNEINLVWTTNFDRIIEDTCFEVFGTSKELSIHDLAGSDANLINAINEARWPILVKLHGDFQSTKLKNTREELRRQDRYFRQAMVESSKRFGLAVSGYSGRDNSIMTAFEEVLESNNPYPRGVFWFHRPDEKVADRVVEFVEKAKEKGVDANLIGIETFDELMESILALQDSVPTDVQEYLDKVPSYCTSAPLNNESGAWPIVRLNGLRVIKWPKTARLVKCDIGGQREVNEAIEQTDLEVIAYRRYFGVFAFGEDTDIKKIFDQYNIKTFDIASISDHSLTFDTQELGLLHEALAKAIEKELPLKFRKKGSTYFIIIDKTKLDHPLFLKLKSEVNMLCGTVPGTNIEWYEAIRIKLDMRYEQLWLLIEPVIFGDYDELSDQERNKVGEFIREKQAKRYNKQWDNLLNCWSNILTADNGAKEFRSIGVDKGIDAKFNISYETAFSWRNR